MKKITEFTIDRTIWLRGENSENSFLLREGDNKKCCIGIYSSACGIPDKKIKNKFAIWTKAADNTIDVEQSDFPINDEDLVEIYRLNDSTEISDSSREKELVDWFNKYNIKLNFIN